MIRTELRDINHLVQQPFLLWISTVRDILAVKLIFVVGFSATLIPFLSKISMLKLVWSKQKISMFKVIEEVIVQSLDLRSCCRAWDMDIWWIWVTSLWLIIVSHRGIKVSLFPVCSFRPCPSHVIQVWLLRFAHIRTISHLVRLVEVIVSSRLHVFTHRSSRLHLLRWIGTTGRFHVVQALSLFEVL
jgi:hypothetical protein